MSKFASKQDKKAARLAKILVSARWTEIEIYKIIKAHYGRAKRKAKRK